MRQVESALTAGLSAGAFASLVSSGVAPGVRGELSLGPRRSSLGLRLAVAGTAAHDDGLEVGRVRWSRASVELGPIYTRRWLRADAGVVGSLLWIEGSGYDENRRSNGAALGVTASLRVAAPLGHVQPWLEIRGIAWPQSQSINVTDLTTGTQVGLPLPHGELHLGAGVALTLF